MKFRNCDVSYRDRRRNREGRAGCVAARSYGYEFRVGIGAGGTKRYMVYQDAAEWRVIDPLTGLSAGQGKTRKAAVDDLARRIDSGVEAGWLEDPRYSENCEEWLNILHDRFAA